MTTINTISSFNEIVLKPNLKPLIICDIDDTIICPDKGVEYFFNLIKKDFPYEPIPWIQKEAIELSNLSRCLNKLHHTDYDGFISLVNRVNNLNGKLVFLTARHEKYIAETKKDFEQIGLNYDDFKVYYTNNEISKGEYIYNKIHLSPYESLIFIDDRDICISSVADWVPYFNCYKFSYKKN
jgi:hypothetical protein